MDNIEAEKIARCNVCYQCGGNLVVMQRVNLTNHRTEYYLRCTVRGCDIAKVGTKRRPLSDREKRILKG